MSFKIGKRPHVGQTVIVHGVTCTIFKVRPAGTIDVVSLDGQRAWRVSGLGFTKEVKK